MKLLPLILENEVNREEDLGKPHVLGEEGYEYLKSEIESMNKKASKWGLPTMDLRVIKEEFVKKTVYVDGNGQIVKNPKSGDPSVEEKEITVKQYEIVIDGQPPSVDGYEFIAKIEHTPAGNILNFAPKSSNKSLPTEYRTARQECDVCKTNRERNNTFILKLEKDDPQRFPDKKRGDYIMVGSGCLKRFLPNVSANSLLQYAEMIENLRGSIEESSRMEGGGGGGTGGSWTGSGELGLWLAATYIHTGKYLSKKKAEEFGTSSTLDRASRAMLSKIGKNEDDIHRKMREDEQFRMKSESLLTEFLQWSKSKDFDSLAQEKPEFSDFFHNLKVISKQDFFKSKNSGFFSALFQLFLRDKGELEKKAALKKSTEDFGYFGEIGGKIKLKAKVTKIKEYESQYGQGLIVNMEGIQTAEDGSLKKGNLLYFTNNFELEEGEEAEIEATVKDQKPNKYTQIPETQITRVKVVNFITHPSKNAGKTKVKDLSGTVKIYQIREDKNWTTSQSTYSVLFRYDEKAHPEMVQSGTNWPIGFMYTVPDEVTYQKLKPYEGKLVNAKWSLVRSINMDKLKSTGTHQVVNFQITQVLGT